MPKILDITGIRFGRLTAIERERWDKHSYWKCRCDCGEIRIIPLGKLRNGHTKSCGCFRRDLTTRKNTTHGMSRKRPYVIWNDMHLRYYNPKSNRYNHYGGRGIKICERWLTSFENFWEDMGPTYESHLTIERIDVNGNYEPRNCKWATYKEQRANQRKP